MTCSVIFQSFKIAFADDLLLIVQYKNFNDACALSQNILDYTFEWSELYKLEFNPSKSKVMMIHKKSEAGS